MLNNVKLGGISSRSTSYESIVNQIIKSGNEKLKHIFIHLNMHNFSVLKNDKRLLEAYSENCEIFFEGIGMKVGSFITSQGWKNDTNGTDLYPILFKKISERNINVFLLGGEQEVIENAVRNINARFPELEITGFRNGYFDIVNDKFISELINNSKPDLLILGMGMQNESDFILSNYKSLSVGAIWCVGGLFDFISENSIRSPKWIREIRLEWLFRFILEPKPKFRRIIITPFWFLSVILIEHYFKKI